MAATEVQISEALLRGANLNKTADKAGDGKIDAEDLAKVKAESAGELDELKNMINDTNHPYYATLMQHFSDANMRKALSELIDDAKKTGGTTVGATGASAAGLGTNHSQEITIASTKATTAMESKLGKMNDANAKDFLGAWQRVWSKVPGTEPTDMEDIRQATNQSRSFNEKLIAALTFEYNENTTTLPIGWFSNIPGWFPALQKNHNFGTTPYNGKTGVEGKRAYILDTMNTLALRWEQANTSNPELLVSTVESIATWALPIFGYPALLLFAGKVGYNMIHDGIRKPGIGEAAGWSSGKVWDGTKWVFTAGKATITTGYKSASGKFETKVESKDLKDTPAYTAEQWATERARLEETTRRMIYMDSGPHPRHILNATSAQILHDVENTPALKAAYDARMVKLTELANTLRGQDKYLSIEAFNKEAGKIVAGDIGEASIRNTVLKRVPFTAERSDYKQTQAALKKVKGEIDAMRARLSAKAMMDGVEIPKMLETQLKAFEDAHKAAYEADLSLDKSRNHIVLAEKRIIAINEVIAHFEEIDKIQSKIDDPVDGIKKKIADLEAKIAGNNTAAHSESPAEQRQREAEGKQGEIDAASREREQAIKEYDNHEEAKREALKDKRSAEQAVLNEEGRIRKDISDRKQFLTDEIAKYPAKIAAAKTKPEKTALGAEETGFQDELNGKKGKVKDLTEQLTPPYTGSALVAKYQAVQDAQTIHNDLTNKDIAVQRKMADANSKITRLAGEKSAILGRAAGADAKSLTATDDAKLKELEAKKSELEGKIKEAKGKIDALAVKPENHGFPWSTKGTLADANNVLRSLEAEIAPGGALNVAKNTAKTARDTAFAHMNTTIVTLNTESARLGEALEIKIPHIAEFRKGQGFSEELSMREHGTSGDKAIDHKLKGTRPITVKTILKTKAP